jgi:hypothetical protein
MEILQELKSQILVFVLCLSASGSVAESIPTTVELLVARGPISEKEFATLPEVKSLLSLAAQDLAGLLEA